MLDVGKDEKITNTLKFLHFLDTINSNNVFAEENLLVARFN
jgi:hypothetical protein